MRIEELKSQKSTLRDIANRIEQSKDTALTHELDWIYTTIDDIDNKIDALDYTFYR